MVILAEKCHLKPSEAALSTAFFRGDFRPEVVSDVISGVNVGRFGLDVLVKFGDSNSNGASDIRLPHFMTNDDHHDEDDHDAGIRWSSHKGNRPKGILALKKL